MKCVGKLASYFMNSQLATLAVLHHTSMTPDFISSPALSIELFLLGHLRLSFLCLGGDFGPFHGSPPLPFIHLSFLRHNSHNSCSPHIQSRTRFSLLRRLQNPEDEKLNAFSKQPNTCDFCTTIRPQRRRKSERHAVKEAFNRALLPRSGMQLAI